MPDPGVLLPLAHAGHWLVWVLYAIPVIAVVAVIVVGSVRERRRRGGTPSGGNADGPSDAD